MSRCDLRNESARFGDACVLARVLFCDPQRVPR